MNLSKLLLYILTLNYVKCLYTNTKSETDLKHPIRWSYPLATYPPYSAIKPDHYRIELEQHESEKFFFGMCVASIKILYSAYIVHLFAQKPHVEILETFLHKTESPELKIIPNEIIYDNVEHIYIFKFEKKLSDGYYIMNTTFISFLGNNEGNFFNSYYKNETGGNEKYIVTHLHPTGARKVFPCWDELMLKTTFSISIKHFNHYRAFSNMPEFVTRISNTYMTWTDFDPTPSIPTYLVAWILINKLSPYLYPISQSRYDTHKLKYMEFAYRVIRKVKLYFVNANWKKAEQFTQLRYSGLPNFQHDGVENWGLIFYKEAAIIYHEELETVARKIDVARLIARKVAYQWFGNIVTPSWWTYAWINEGIATLLATDAIDEIFPNFRIWDLFIVQIQQESLRLEATFVMKSLKMQERSIYDYLKYKYFSEINSLFSFEYYVKGNKFFSNMFNLIFVNMCIFIAPAVLRMLRDVVSYQVFQESVKKFLKSSDSDFWSIIQNATNLSPGFMFSIREMMSIFTQSNYVFVLTVAQYNTETVRIMAASYPTNKKEIWIPVSNFMMSPSYSTYINLNWLIMTKLTRYLDIKIINDSLILINVEGTGYYRVKYDIENWHKISKYLNYKNYTKIHVLNRAKIIDDAFYFMMKGELDVSIFLELLSYLRRERDYIPWFPLFKALEYMSSFFLLIPDSAIKEHMKYILGILLNDIGYAEVSDDIEFIKLLRQEAVRWACIFNISNCINNATSNMLQHLRNERNKPLPWWKKWTYCNGLMYTDHLTWWSVFNKWKNEHDDSLMEYLSCTMSDQNIQKYLNLRPSSNCISGIKCKDANTRAKERVIRFLLIIAKHSKNSMILEYLKKSYDTVKPSEVSTIAAIIVMINNAYSTIQLESISELVEYLLLDKKHFFPKDLYVKIIFNKVKTTIIHFMENKSKQIFTIIRYKIMNRNLEIKKQKESYDLIHIR